MKNSLDTTDYRDPNNNITKHYTFLQNKAWTEYRQNKQYHRTTGPAIMHANGYQAYYQNGKRHRIDGPAIIYSDGTTAHYIHGIKQNK